MKPPMSPPPPRPGPPGPPGPPNRPAPPQPPAALESPADRTRLVEAIFLAALEKGGEEREAFVAERCGGNAALRAEVEELLAADAAQPDFLPNGAEHGSVEEAGDTIGHFKLREQIGEGGFGTVWVAEQEQPVRRRVALKVIKLGMDTKEVIARFEQERQALAMMDHPNIAKVLDAGATATGRPYFVMELVRGLKITEYCDEKQLSTDERVELFITVCQAVQHAHQKGIIHRDLKPSNILVTVNDGVAVPKVIDFGVAKATQGRLTEQTVYTQFQQMIGTPLYMSPEQADMTSLDVDTRSDIYSLGVLLYELLTGYTPIDAETMQQAGLDEMRRIIREVDPPRPSARVKTMGGAELTTAAKRRHTEPAKLPSALRGDLDWIVMKCLEKDRQRRYDTANGLALDLQRHLHNEVVVARPPTAGYLLSKLVRRHKVAFAAGAVIVAALVVAIAGTTYGLFRANRAAESERLAKQEAQAKTVEVTEQKRLAEEAGKKAAESEHKATEQATTAGLLANYVNAKYMLSQGRIGPAYEAISAAMRIRPHWEYCKLLWEIVATSRKDWRAVARFAEVTEPTPSAAFAGPGGRMLAVVSGSRLRLYDVASSRLLGETTLATTPAIPFRIGERELGVSSARGVRIFSVDNLATNRSVPFQGDVKLAESDLTGRLLAVLSPKGDTTIFETSTMKSLASRRLDVVAPGPGSPAVPILSFSPSGNSLLFTSGLWTKPSTIWNWAEDKAGERPIENCVAAYFLDEQTAVSIERWDATVENMRINLNNLEKIDEPRIQASFASRGTGNYHFWRMTDAKGKITALAACTSADSIDILSLTEQKVVSSTRFTTLQPTCPVEPRFLAHHPESGLLAIAGDKEVMVFQSTGYKPFRVVDGVPASMNYWSLAAANDFIFTATTTEDQTKLGYLQLERRSFHDASLTQIPCQWPKASEGKKADVWGLSVTPDGKTAAALWQEDSTGYIDGEFYRKAILVYQLDSPPNDHGQLVPQKTIWLEKYQGLNGRVNRFICLSPDARTVTFVSASGDATIYRVEDGTMVADLKVGLSAFASPDGSLFCGGSYRENKPIQVWRSDTGAPVFSTPNSGLVSTAAISRDNQKLYVGWRTGVIETYDLVSGKSVGKISSKISPLSIFPRGDRFVGFLPDNNKTTNVNGSVVLGSLTDGQAVLVLTEGAHVLNRTFISQSGEDIAYMKARGSARIACSVTLEQALKQFELITPLAVPGAKK